MWVEDGGLKFHFVVALVKVLTNILVFTSFKGSRNSRSTPKKLVLLYVT